MGGTTETKLAAKVVVGVKIELASQLIDRRSSTHRQDMHCSDGTL